MNIQISSRTIIFILTFGLVTTDTLTIDKENIAIGSASAIIGTLTGSIVYGHIILPWYTHSREKAEQKRLELLHCQQKEQLQTLCHSIKDKYANTNIPTENSHAISKFKEELFASLADIEKMLKFNWDCESEREGILKLQQTLKETLTQLNKILGLTVGKEVHEQYKDELALMVQDNKPDDSKMSRVIYEKFGNKPYKFTTYKTCLDNSMAYCNKVGAPQETLLELEKLNRCTNLLFASALAEERAAQENAVKQEQLHQAELDNKHAIKDFYQTADEHVKKSSQTVAHFAAEMNQQCEANKSILQSISNFLATWGIRSEQQTERVVYEVRHDGQRTREAIATLNAKASAAEHKAEKAQQQATEAKCMAQAAMPPMPPAFNPSCPPQGGTMPEPSAPPYEGPTK
jgi:hypothetical protein